MNRRMVGATLAVAALAGVCAPGTPAHAGPPSTQAAAWSWWQDTPATGVSGDHVHFTAASPVVTATQVGQRVVFTLTSGVGVRVDPSTLRVHYGQDAAWTPLGQLGTFTATGGQVQVPITAAMVGHTVQVYGQGEVTDTSRTQFEVDAKVTIGGGSWMARTMTTSPHPAPVIVATGNGGGGQTSVWGGWLATANQGVAADRIAYSVVTPTITSADVGKQLVMWSEGDWTAPVEPGLFAGGYFNRAHQWVGLGPRQKVTSRGDVAALTATITADMVGSTVQAGGRLRVTTSALLHPLRGQVWIGGVSKGAAVTQVPEPAAAPATQAGTPVQAAAAGFTHRSMVTDFTSMSSIDLTGKGNLTKQWFTDRAWNPNLPADNLKATPGGTMIDPDANVGPNYNLATVSHTGGGGHGFKYGYFQARLKFNPDTPTTPQTSTQTGGWPSWWLYSYDALRTQNMPHSNEIDALEYNNGDAGSHRYTGGLCDHLHGVNTGSGGAAGNDMVFPSNRDPHGWNTYGILWTPGKVQWDIDGVVSKTITYGNTVHPSINGVVQTQLPVGLFAHLDDATDGMGLLLGTGKGDPLSVADVQVWQTP